ncbi:uncharacterized protein CPUR_08836 [Claviceps purpurea 20.1]|uniref:Uncharacterized protein n=1 Tax=Claviceps purpurea (strain 20.1) TaxID=1111077 RepID=M1VZF5_CLAP2|nr:hypothetical protein E4U23_005275 [Claviceps purpurea]KAG6309804.1 hypothetical protein E4U44_006379 [Claviceps purpurea]CCE34897.1 uncharacterized protein CPUR_08836 [Claviceps purpurea 20.1]
MFAASTWEWIPFARDAPPVYPGRTQHNGIRCGNMAYSRQTWESGKGSCESIHERTNEVPYRDRGMKPHPAASSKQSLLSRLVHGGGKPSSPAPTTAASQIAAAAVYHVPRTATPDKVLEK